MSKQPSMPPRTGLQDGFTLVELVIVIVVLGILGSVAVPRFIDFGGSAREANVREILGRVRTDIATEQAANALPARGSTARSPTTDELRKMYGDNFPENPYSTGRDKSQIIESSRGVDRNSNFGTNGAWAYNPKNGEFWANTTSKAQESNW